MPEGLKTMEGEGMRHEAVDVRACVRACRVTREWVTDILGLVVNRAGTLHRKASGVYNGAAYITVRPTHCWLVKTFYMEILRNTVQYVQYQLYYYYYLSVYFQGWIFLCRITLRIFYMESKPVISLSTWFQLFWTNIFAKCAIVLEIFSGLLCKRAFWCYLILSIWNKMCHAAFMSSLSSQQHWIEMEIEKIFSA